MFVFRREDLPPGPVFPADLEQLGYFINSNDQIRKISAPDQEFQFKINRNPRWNEVQRGAMNECIRNIVSTRLRSLGMITLHVPLSAGPSDPRIPVLVSSNLSTASRIVVVFGEPIQDLGIWAYRSVGSDGINAGSAVSMAHALLSTSSPREDTQTEDAQEKDTALILANTGQLIWHCASAKPVTHATWLALPRRSAVDPPVTMSTRNKIPRNESWQEHVNCVFEDILAARGNIVRQDVKIDVIGLAEGGLGTIRYLRDNWNSWRPYISALCLSNPLHFTHVHLTDSDPADPASFAAFVSSRCRAYVLAPEPLGVPVQGYREHGCNCYSSGEALNTECIMPSAWRAMLEWLEKVNKDPDLCEPRLVIRDVDFDEVAGIVGGDVEEEG